MTVEAVAVESAPPAAPKRGRPPKATTPAPAGRRPGRPPAPQSPAELQTAFVKALQTARKANAAALGLLDRLRTDADARADRGAANWHHVSQIRAELEAVDYTLHAAQRTVTPSEFALPSAKLD